MNKLIILGLAATFGTANVLMRTMLANPPVELQPISPGVAQSGHLNISGTATVGQLKSQGTVYGSSSAPTGSAYGGFFTVASNQGRGFYGFASSPTGLTYGGFFQNASNQGRGVYGLATATTGSNFGGYFQTASSAGRGVFGVATSSTGTGAGVYGRSYSPSGYGVYSEGRMWAAGASATSIIRGENTSTAYNSAGVVGEASGGSSIGVVGLGGARGVEAHGYTIGVDSTSTGYGSKGVVGISFGSGETFGGDFSVNSIDTNATGVRGTAEASTGVTYGVWGRSNSTSGYGVAGIDDSTSGACYGVYGRSGSASGFGVFSAGNMGASGTKPFRIDHPLDPENKYLLHYAAESPMPQNFYVGNIVTDSKGYAWVQLPDYFAEINTNFKYQLTVISRGEDFVQAMVSKEIHGNQFQVRTSAPNIKVSWRVDADRNDLFVRNRPPKDVIDKEGPEKGTYQHPEFYGLGPERGMNYRPERNRPPIEPSSKARSLR